MYKCMHVKMYVCKDVYMYKCFYVYMYLCIYVYMYKCMAGCRIRWIGGDTKWLVLDRMIFKSREFFEELQSEKIEAKNRRSSGVKNKKRKLGVW